MTVETIMQAIAKHYGVTVSELLSNDKDSRVARPRKIALYMARKYTTKPLDGIASAFCVKRATVLYSETLVGSWIKKDPAVASDIQRILGEATPIPVTTTVVSTGASEELVRFSWGAGKSRTVRINGDPQHVSFQATVKPDETIITIYAK